MFSPWLNQAQRIGLLFTVLAAVFAGCSHAVKPPIFSLSLNPKTLTVAQGTSASATLTVTPQNGFSGTVHLSIARQDGTPAPAGIILSPTSVSVSGQAKQVTLILNVASIANAGTYPLRLVGTSGSTTAHVDFSLTVTANPGSGGGGAEAWQCVRCALFDIAYGNGTFVAVGSGGTILISR